MNLPELIAACAAQTVSDIHLIFGLPPM
ncbi:MAG: hypothetical protein RR450_05195, partial [Oscillospiraceae bacterium]